MTKIEQKQEEIISNLKEVGSFYFQLRGNASKKDVEKMKELTDLGYKLESELAALKEQYKPSEEEQKGVYGKYIVQKTDGTPIDPYAKYFVLRTDKDPHARIAIKAYAQSVKKENPKLWIDIETIYLGDSDEPIDLGQPLVSAEEFILYHKQNIYLRFSKNEPDKLYMITSILEEYASKMHLSRDKVFQILRKHLYDIASSEYIEVIADEILKPE